MYEVRLYKGDYKYRQKQANEDRCAAYVEQHFNSSANEDANYTVVIVDNNASETSKCWGKWYAKKVAKAFNIPTGGIDGLKIGGYGGRGVGNLRYTRMPAILLEPFFVSNPVQAAWLQTEDCQNKLADILVESIVAFFPEGNKIGFSIGHKYKDSHPNDRGAIVYGGGTEADYAEIVLKKAQTILEGY